MGIPSYYKRLSKTIKNLVVHHRNDGSFKAGALLFDFNCMIYQVIRSPTMRPFPGYDHPDAAAWEKDVCQAVVDYTVKVWQEVGKPKTVFLGLDGVVPMAKIRQQRMRRFKSIWTAEEEKARGIRDAEANHWDTNAITPGTEFMEKLGRRLGDLCAIQKWTLSDTTEQGEGEHKCMKFWRGLPPIDGSLVIYGLDADLILLCLLTQQLTGRKNSVWCIRETAEWEGGKDKGLAEFMRLSIDTLQGALVSSKMDPLQWTLDYVASMSFLGNDFVPHGLSLKIRDGGHDRLLKDLKRLHDQGKTLTKFVEGRGWTYQKESVIELITHWEAEEESKILEFMKNKAVRVNYEDWQMTPCEWKVEERLLCETRGKLWNDWEDRLYKGWFGPGVDGDCASKFYVEGLQWILDYYTQQNAINTHWMYPWGLPPTWRSLRKFLRNQDDDVAFRAPALDASNPTQPEEQLAMVLPRESWHLIRTTRLRKLPDIFPHYWPKKYGFFSAGKIFMWECEAEIPLLHLPIVRSVP
jgi:5'-3' exonuclease